MGDKNKKPDDANAGDVAVAGDKQGAAKKQYPDPAKETGGPSGPEPTRYGDWEQKGRCSDF